MAAPKSLTWCFREQTGFRTSIMPLHLRRQAIAPKAVFYKMVVLQRYPVPAAAVEFFLTFGHGIPFTRHFQCLTLLHRNNYGIDPAIFSMDTGAVLGSAKI